MTIVKVDGKSRKNPFVPVLLTNNMKLALDTLIEYRHDIGISTSNIYVFANSKESHLRSHDCLRLISVDAKTEYPERIQTTKLRKYIATVVQLFDLQEVHLDLLAKHLGHDLAIHRQFYRIQEDAAEATLVAKLLLAVNSGKAAQLRGKTLTEMETIIDGGMSMGYYAFKISIKYYSLFVCSFFCLSFFHN